MGRFYSVAVGELDGDRCSCWLFIVGWCADHEVMAGGAAVNDGFMSSRLRETDFGGYNFIR